MSKKRKRTGSTQAAVLGAAVAGILGTLSLTQSANAESPAPDKRDEPGMCVAANSCKGKSACATPDGSNSCKGMNSCQGKGVARMSRAECTRAAKKLKNKKIVFQAGWTGM
jgi:hypothetical protein